MRSGVVVSPRASALGHLKNNPERPIEKLLEFYIRTTPERLWEALTAGDIRSRYQFGHRVSSDWTPGSPYEMMILSGLKTWLETGTILTTPGSLMYG